MNLSLLSLDRVESLPGLQELLLAAVQEADFWHTDPHSAAQLLGDRTYGSGESFLIVAQDDAKANKGFAVAVPFLDPLSGERRPLLLFLWVESGLRRHGIARAMVLELRRLLKLEGSKGLQARIPHGDDALLSMGERWGLVRQWEILADY